jgi:hypothetical protein
MEVGETENKTTNSDISATGINLRLKNSKHGTKIQFRRDVW